MTSINSSASVIAVVVTFHPELPALQRLLSAIRSQVEKVVVVDNGTGGTAVGDMVGAQDSEGRFHFIPLGDNLGIASAQNAGIQWARLQDANFVILFDQDSEPASDMVERLLLAARSKIADGIALAATGPRYLDERQHNPPPFIQIKGGRVQRQPCPGDDAVVAVDYLIASGCLIPVAALDTAGGMADDLFIDYVDIEWGLRAKTFGLQCFGVCGAYMRHSLGDEPIEFVGRQFPARSPLRHYYMFRNALWLYRQGNLPMGWKIADGTRLVLRFGFYSLFAKPRAQQIKMMMLGVWHGLMGRLGKYRS